MVIFANSVKENKQQISEKEQVIKSLRIKQGEQTASSQPWLPSFFIFLFSY